MATPLPPRCGHCGKPNGTLNSEDGTPIKLKICTGCRRVYYCDAECQRSARPKHKATCSPRMIRLPEDHPLSSSNFNDGTKTSDKIDNEVLEKEERQLTLLARNIIEQKIRPEVLREDVTGNLATWLREMLLGPALPLNKEKNFIEDIIKDEDFCADAEIFVETLPGCHASLIQRNRQDEAKKGKYPDPDAKLRVREDVLRARCLAMVNHFAQKKDIEEDELKKKAAREFYDYYVTTILERRPKSYNSYTGLTAVMGDVKFLKRSEDIVMHGLGLLKELPVDKTAPVIESAPPPWHTLLVYGLIVSVCLWKLPTLESIDESATIETFTISIFKEGMFYLSPLALGIIRMIFAFICLIVTRAKWKNGVMFQLTYLPQSNLQRGVLELSGWKTQGFYTSWAWNLLGLSFFLGGIIPLLVVVGRADVLSDYPWLLRGALVSFEISAPSAFLTSTVVTYGLWPRAFKTHGPSGTVGFKGWVNLFQHNGNTAMVLMEVCLMGGLPVKLSHAAFAPIFASIYQAFLWCMTNRWSPRRGPVFVYFFMDTTLGAKTTIFMVVLLTIMLVFFILFALLDMMMLKIEEGDHGSLPNLLCVMLISFLLMKFRD